MASWHQRFWAATYNSALIYGILVYCLLCVHHGLRSFGILIGELICGKLNQNYIDNFGWRTRRMVILYPHSSICVLLIVQLQVGRGEPDLYELCAYQMQAMDLANQYGLKLVNLATECLQIWPAARIQLRDIIRQSALESASKAALIQALLRDGTTSIGHFVLLYLNF